MAELIGTAGQFASGLREYLMDMFASHGEGEVRLSPIRSTRPGTQYVRVTVGDKGESYVVKAWLHRTHEGGRLEFLRGKQGKKPAELEAAVISAYSKNGANVPSIPEDYPPTEDVLVLTDVGMDFLDRRMENVQEKDAINLLEKGLLELDNFHKVGAQIQAPLIDRLPIGLVKPRFDKKAAEFYRILTSDAASIQAGRKRKAEGEDEFNYTFQPVIQQIGGGETQLIHGDLTTYHVALRQMPDGEKVYFIDLGSSSVKPVKFDTVDLMFSPGIPIKSLDTKLGIHREHIKTAKLADVKGAFTRIAAEVLSKEEKRLCFTGVFECVRRAARAREYEAKHPEELGGFAEDHPAYAHPIPHYRATVDQLIGHLLANSGRLELKDFDAQLLERLKPILSRIMANGSGKRSLTSEEQSTITRSCTMGNLTSATGTG